MSAAWAGRHVVIVGASSQIGVAAARAFAAAGADVTGLSRTVGALETPPFARTFACDVSSAESVAGAFARARAHASIDALVYVSGAPAMGKTLAVPEKAARESFEVNFWGLDRTVREVLPAMSAQRKGSIVAVLSLAAVRAVPHESYYAASKAAAARYLECLAHEAAAANVAVGYVAPGFIDTGFYKRGGWFGMDVPSVNGSGTTPSDVADACLEMASGSTSVHPSKVLGWRERVIVMADRVAPGLYDRWLRRSSAPSP